MKFVTKTRLAVAVVVGLAIVSLLGVDIIKKNHQQRDTSGGTEKAVANNVQQAGGINVTGIIAPEGPIVPLAPSVKGEVIEVFVKDEQQVKKGQLLLKMDDRYARFKLAEADNAVESAEALAEKAKRGMREWENGREQLEIKLANAKKDYERAWNLMNRLKKLADDGTTATAKDDHKDAVLQAEKASFGIKAAEKQIEEVDIKKPVLEGKQAEVAVKHAKVLQSEAKLGVEMCELRASTDGTIVQSFVAVGVKFGEQAVRPAFMFYSGPLVVKAELNQEWAHKVKEGMTATITDAGASGLSWKGRVNFVAHSFMPRRDASGGLEGVNLLQQSQELVLECRIALDPDQTTPFLNQKVRVHIGQ